MDAHAGNRKRSRLGTKSAMRYTKAGVLCDWQEGISG